MPEPGTAAAVCGFRYDLWDGPYVMRRECTAPAGHSAGAFAQDHGPWRDLPRNGPAEGMGNASYPSDGGQG